MKDYKEPIPRVQKRSQLKRLFGIMGGMIFTFAVFIGGVKVGIELERERVRIAQETTAPMTASKEREGTDRSGKETSPPAPEKKDERMRFTFYETLTRKEGVEKETQEQSQTAKKEQKVTEKKGEEGTPPLSKKVQEGKEAPQELYYVQIASFREKETAEGLRGRLVKKGYQVHVVPVQIEGMGLWYRVRLGGYTTLKEAQEAQKRVSVEEGIEGTKVISGP